MKSFIPLLLFTNILCWTVSCDQVSAGRGHQPEQELCDSLAMLQIQFSTREWDVLKVLSTATDPGSVYREELDGLLQPEAAAFSHKLRLIRKKLEQVLTPVTGRLRTDSLTRNKWLADLQASGCIQGAAAMNLDDDF